MHYVPLNDICVKVMLVPFSPDEVYKVLNLVNFLYLANLDYYHVEHMKDHHPLYNHLKFLEALFKGYLAIGMFGNHLNLYNPAHKILPAKIVLTDATNLFSLLRLASWALEGAFLGA